MAVKEGEISRIRQYRSQNISFEKIRDLTGHSKTTIQKYCKDVVPGKPLNGKQIDIPIRSPVTVSIIVPSPNYDELLVTNKKLENRIKDLEEKLER